MSAEMGKDVIRSKLWEESAEPDNPFTANACFCSGYDVYGQVLQQATYLEYVYLLFRGERPSGPVLRSLEILAIAIANPGPRDPSVHAAMSASVGGSPAAAALMAALAAGAGVSGGAREVYQAMQLWAQCGCVFEAWQTALAAPSMGGKMQVWPEAEHPPGFAAYGGRCAQPVLQTLAALSANVGLGCTQWLADSRERLETIADHPLAMPGVIAVALTDMGFTPTAGEMLSLLLRLPGAAAHALEQGETGYRHFPFFSLDIGNDPGPVQKAVEKA
nr:citryl-CoA lyase [Rhodoferax sp.]